MDPVAEFLATHYKMSPELATRVAGNLVRNGAWDSYPGAREAFEKSKAPSATLDHRVATQRNLSPEESYGPPGRPHSLDPRMEAFNARFETPKPLPRQEMTSEEMAAYLGVGAVQGGIGGAQANPEMQARDEEISKIGQFFGPDAEARRAKVPQYWNSPAGKARLAEMEARRKAIEDRNNDFRSLTPVKK